MGALRKFEQAAKLAPEWPYPPYDAAYTYLLMKDDAKALEMYERADRMAPRGFFTVKTAVAALRQEKAGTLPRGTYLKFLALEWTDDPKKQAQIVDDLNAKVPNFAPAWLKRSELETSVGKALADLERGLKSGPDVSTQGMLMINKGLTLFKMKHKGEALRILGTVALDPGSPPDITAMAKYSLANVVEHWNE